MLLNNLQKKVDCLDTQEYQIWITSMLVWCWGLGVQICEEKK